MIAILLEANECGRAPIMRQLTLSFARTPISKKECLKENDENCSLNRSEETTKEDILLNSMTSPTRKKIDNFAELFGQITGLYDQQQVEDHFEISDIVYTIHKYRLVCSLSKHLIQQQQQQQQQQQHSFDVVILDKKLLDIDNLIEVARNKADNLWLKPCICFFMINLMLCLMLIYKDSDLITKDLFHLMEFLNINTYREIIRLFLKSCDLEDYQSCLEDSSDINTFFELNEVIFIILLKHPSTQTFIKQKFQSRKSSTKKSGFYTQTNQFKNKFPFKMEYSLVDEHGNSLYLTPGFNDYGMLIQLNKLSTGESVPTGQISSKYTKDVHKLLSSNDIQLNDRIFKPIKDYSMLFKRFINSSSMNNSSEKTINPYLDDVLDIKNESDMMEEICHIIFSFNRKFKNKTVDNFKRTLESLTITISQLYCNNVRKIENRKLLFLKPFIVRNKQYINSSTNIIQVYLFALWFKNLYEI